MIPGDTTRRPLKKGSRLHAQPLLSILVPTMPGREGKLASLLAILDGQIDDRPDVELLVLRDNRGMTIGEKRNRMVQIARGTYVTFVDDDDLVSADYVAAITAKLAAESPDVLCYLLVVEGHGNRRLCRYHPDLRHQNLPHEYRRKPNHLMVWRREIALREQYPPIQTGEDTMWADQMAKHAKKISVIDRILYTYRFDPNDNSALNVQT